MITPEEITVLLEAHAPCITGCGQWCGCDLLSECECGWVPESASHGWAEHRAHVAEVLAALMPEATETVEWGTGPRRRRKGPYVAMSERSARNLATDGNGPDWPIFRRTRTSYADRVTDWEEVGDE